MTTPHEIVFLLDVDNTLLDNDQIIADLQRHLEQNFGAASANRYWVIFEALRNELGYADYLGALQRYRLDAGCAVAARDQVDRTGRGKNQKHPQQGTR